MSIPLTGIGFNLFLGKAFCHVLNQDLFFKKHTLSIPLTGIRFHLFLGKTFRLVLTQDVFLSELHKSFPYNLFNLNSSHSLLFSNFLIAQGFVAQRFEMQSAPN